LFKNLSIVFISIKSNQDVDIEKLTLRLRLREKKVCFGLAEEVLKFGWSGK
jgi:hypothetical protein